MVALLFALCNFGLKLGCEARVDAAKFTQDWTDVLRFAIEVEIAELQECFAISGPDVDGFFVSSLGGVPLFLFAKRVAEVEEFVRLD